MFRFFDEASYDFLGMKKKAFVIAFAFMVPGLLFFLVRPVNLSIEFTGGTFAEVRSSDPNITTEDVRNALNAVGLGGAEISLFGAETEFAIRARLESSEEGAEETTQQTADAIERALTDSFGQDVVEIVRTEAIGPKVGGELRQKALLAILLGFLAIFIYLSMRMEWRFAIAAVAATIHDILSSWALVSYLNIEVSLAVATALLFIVGYSVNDTIVTFDRVRENLHRFKRNDLYQLLNKSINETLPRTVLTSGTTIVATLALVFLGGEVLRGFALVMTFGVITGTFSSIFIASPLLHTVEQRWPGRDVHGVKAMADGTTVVRTGGAEG
ncbi:MAG: protein translocase subunit SecF [Gemmatimonadota bacterium]|nr:protein translocase subunit SecF [Gemmatimonadota bacterium]MDH5804273.1 protein translocase subunit SecF [Gemmatimonadota bacterium]